MREKGRSWGGVELVGMEAEEGVEAWEGEEVGNEKESEKRG